MRKLQNIFSSLSYPHPIGSILNLLLAILFLYTPTVGQPTFKYLSTVDEVCSERKEEIVNLFEALNLDTPGLESTKEYMHKGDLIKAATSLLAYFRTKPIPPYARSLMLESKQKTSLETAEQLLTFQFTFYDQKSRLPYNEKGMMDWQHKGPLDDQEWAWALNRHHYLVTLVEAFHATGDAKYAQAVDHHIQDWILQSIPYPARKSSTAMWRGLEVSARVKNWAIVFYALKNSGHLSEATQLLILSSLPYHADYARKFHAKGNWLTMEMSGLARLASSWPEFKSAPEWMAYTKHTMTESLFEQVYPDGVQNELTSHYHRVALHNFELFQQICEEVGETLDKTYTDLLDRMRSYLAYTMRPDGHGLLNNDSDLDHNRAKVLAYADQYQREDWRYIATNGRDGVKPPGPPSVFYPWAGHLIARSGYDADAHWSYFDIGPWGTGHQHNDKLHISIFAHGKDLLVDGGRFAYRGEIAERFGSYALGSDSHNILLIDGKGQNPGPKAVDEPLTETHIHRTEEYDCAWGAFSDFKEVEGKVTHQRTFFYLRNGFWLVLDKIKTDRPRKVEALWHWHPDNQVKLTAQKEVYTANPKGNLVIHPLGKVKWEVQTVKGQDTPKVQGWYSEKYNQFEPNPTSIYSTQLQGDQVFGWLLFPYAATRPRIVAEFTEEADEKVRVKIEIDKGKLIELLLPLQNPAGVQILKRP